MAKISKQFLNNSDKQNLFSGAECFEGVLDYLTEGDNWPKFEILLRKATRAVAHEWTKTPAYTKGVKIDIKTLIKELGSGALNADLQHFFTWNHRWISLLSEKNRRAAVESFDFVDEAMPNAVFSLDQMSIIESKKDQMMNLNGHIVDLGVYKGGSTRALARIFPGHVIHGFDSFEGLPEDWSHVLKGSFGEIEGVLPDMPDNVRLYKGWFDDTLPGWAEKYDGKPISILRVDCAIYSSTKTIFDTLGHLVKSGTWIVFDELIGYRGFKSHEYKAFKEFQVKTGIEFEYVAFGLTYALGYVK